MESHLGRRPTLGGRPAVLWPPDLHHIHRGQRTSASAARRTWAPSRPTGWASWRLLALA